MAARLPVCAGPPAADRQNRIAAGPQPDIIPD